MSAINNWLMQAISMMTSGDGETPAEVAKRLRKAEESRANGRRVIEEHARNARQGRQREAVAEAKKSKKKLPAPPLR